MNRAIQQPRDQLLQLVPEPAAHRATTLAGRPPALRRRAQRRVFSALVMALAALTLVLGLSMLAWILATLIGRGAPGLTLAFFTELPHPPGVPGGGLANALLGTALLTGLAIGLGVPLGIASGVWLAEFGRGGKLARTIRFLADVLMGVPSIVIGVFVYALVVGPMGTFSALAGGIALSLLMVPIVTRTTEEMLRVVPTTLREAALALGAPVWRTTVSIAMRAALPGILTGVLLAIARVGGETAPLLFTALNTPYAAYDLSKPVGTLNVTLFQYAMSPYADWQQLAWTAALVLTAAVLVLTLLGRLLRRAHR